MAAAIYAGSFDPWSFGHQYVLDSAQSVFDVVHVLAAINPSKQGSLSPDMRARVIAHSINPFEDWSSFEPPFQVGPKIMVSSTTGLVVDYARSHNVTHLVRGLRSTSDFESEFNLYFSNRAIHPQVQTWAIMCPPELLHCSSSYVRTVVGKPHVDFVGTGFLAQALMLGKPEVLGRLFDLIQACSVERFAAERSDLEKQDLNGALQSFFSILISMEPHVTSIDQAKVTSRLAKFLKARKVNIQQDLQQQKYPNTDVANLWALLVAGVTPKPQTTEACIETLHFLGSLARKLGRSRIPLFDAGLVEKVLADLTKKP